MTTGAATSHRLAEIDELRGIAALGVLLFHFTGHYGRLYEHHPRLSFAFDAGNYGGWCGCMAIFALAMTGRLPFLTPPVLVFCGGISYTLYLVHQNIGYVEISLLEKIGVPPASSIFMAMAASMLLAWILSVTVERPAMQLIRRVYIRLQAPKVIT